MKYIIKNIFFLFILSFISILGMESFSKQGRILTQEDLCKSLMAAMRKYCVCRRIESSEPDPKATFLCTIAHELWHVFDSLGSDKTVNMKTKEGTLFFFSDSQSCKENLSGQKEKGDEGFYIHTCTDVLEEGKGGKFYKRAVCVLHNFNDDIQALLATLSGIAAQFSLYMKTCLHAHCAQLYDYEEVCYLTDINKTVDIANKLLKNGYFFTKDQTIQFIVDKIFQYARTFYAKGIWRCAEELFEHVDFYNTLDVLDEDTKCLLKNLGEVYNTNDYALINACKVREVKEKVEKNGNDFQIKVDFNSFAEAVKMQLGAHWSCLEALRDKSNTLLFFVNKRRKDGEFFSLNLAEILDPLMHTAVFNAAHYYIEWKEVSDKEAWDFVEELRSCEEDFCKLLQETGDEKAFYSLLQSSLRILRERDQNLHLGYGPELYSTFSECARRTYATIHAVLKFVQAGKSYGLKKKTNDLLS